MIFAMKNLTKNMLFLEQLREIVVLKWPTFWEIRRLKKEQDCSYIFQLIFHALILQLISMNWNMVYVSANRLLEILMRQGPRSRRHLIASALHATKQNIKVCKEHKIKKFSSSLDGEVDYRYPPLKLRLCFVKDGGVEIYALYVF